MVNKKFLIIGLGAVASVAIVATPLAIVSKMRYKGDSIKNVQDALSKITNVSFQSGDGDGKINNNVSYSRLKSFYFDSSNKPNNNFVVSNFDFFEQKDKQFEKIDDKSLGNFKIVVDDFQANDTDKNFTIFYHVEATQPNEFGQIVKSEIGKAKLNFGVVPQFLLATEAHSKLAEFEKAITSSEAFQVGNTDIQPLTPYSIAQFKASVEKDAKTVIRPLALVTESDFANDINSATSSDDAIYLLSKYFNFQDVFGQILKNGDYKFSLVKNPNLSQKPGEGEYVTKVNDAGKSLFRLYLKTEFSDEYKANNQHLPELNAAHIDIIDFDLSNDKFKDLFLKPNFTSDWTVKTPTKDDYYITKPTIDQAAATAATQASVQSTPTTNGQTTSSQTSGQQQSTSNPGVTTNADVTTTNGAANPSTSTTSDTTDESKVDSSRINVFNFLSHINGTFFATKEERNKFVTSYIDSMLKNGLKPSYQGQNEGVKSLSDKEKDLLFNYNVEVDADSLTLAYDEKEQKPVIKGRLTYSVTGKPISGEVKEKVQTPLQVSTSPFQLDNFKDFDAGNTNPGSAKGAYAYKQFQTPSVLKDFLFDGVASDYVKSNSKPTEKLPLSELLKSFVSDDNNKLYKLLSNPNYYGFVFNSARKLDALTKEFNIPSLESIPSTFENATSKENVKNNVLNIDSKIFKNDLDVLRFYFSLEKQGFTKVAEYLFNILKSTGNIPADSKLDVNKPIFEQLSKIALTKTEFKTLSFANSYQLEGINDYNSFDLSSLSTSNIDAAISNQIEEGTITSDSKILSLIKTSDSSYNDANNDANNDAKFKSAADILLAFYGKLYDVIDFYPLGFSKIQGNLGYQLEFVANGSTKAGDLLFYNSQNQQNYNKLSLGYKYRVGFVDSKNPNVITHELFQTKVQQLDDIKPFDDKKTSTQTQTQTQKVEEKIDSVPDYYKTFYLPKEEYDNVGAKFALQVMNKKTPIISTEGLWKPLHAPQIQDFYKQHFGKDVKFWVITGFVPDNAAKVSDDETDAESLPKVNTDEEFKYDISWDMVEEAGLKDVKVLKVKSDREYLVSEFNKGPSNTNIKSKFNENYNYKEVRLFVQSGKEISDKPLIIRVYEQK